MKLIPKEIDFHVGAKLGFLRKSLGYSQSELANKLGLTLLQIQKYEHGKDRISASRLWQLCICLQVTPNDFFDGLEDEISVIQGKFSRNVFKTAQDLHKLENSDLKESMLELIRVCNSDHT